RGMRFALGLGEASHRREIYVAAVILRNVVLPEHLHSGNIIFHLAPSMLEIAAQGSGFLRVPSSTDADQDASAAVVVERGDLFRSEDRVALRNQTNAGAELDAARRSARPRQSKQRVRQLPKEVRHSATLSDAGILNTRCDRNDRVVTNPVGFETEILSAFCHDRRVRLAIRSDMH